MFKVVSYLVILVSVATSGTAHPTATTGKRAVTSLNQAAFEEAHQRDDNATRAFSKTQVKTSTGKCLFVDELSGDFRANLNPIQVAPCDGSAGQQWDVITSGKHNNRPGAALIVNTLTQACMNFDPRRVAGNQAIMFSCGGRADGGGRVTDSQLFAFDGGAAPLSLSPLNAKGTCLSVTGKELLDQAACKEGDANQLFTFGDGADSAMPGAGGSVGDVSGVGGPTRNGTVGSTTKGSSCDGVQ